MTAEAKRTFAFLGVLTCLAALIWFAIVRPAQAWKAKEIAALSEAQERSSILGERLAELRHEKDVLSAATGFEGIWSAATAGEATARVQATLSDLARRNGIALRAITPLRAARLPLKQAVSFRIEAEAPLDRLVSFLRDAEFHTPLLAFDKGTVRRLARPALKTPQPVVFFQFDVTAPYDLAEEG